MRRPLFSHIKFFWLMNTNWKFQFDVWNRISLTLDRNDLNLKSDHSNSSRVNHTTSSNRFTTIVLFSISLYLLINYVIVLFLNGLIMFCCPNIICFNCFWFNHIQNGRIQFKFNLLRQFHNLFAKFFDVHVYDLQIKCQFKYSNIVFVLRSHLGSCVVHMVGITLFWQIFPNLIISICSSFYLHHKSDARSSQPSQPYINTAYLWASIHCMRT